MLDNGTDATAIAPHVFQTLGLKSGVSGRSQTAAGQVTLVLPDLLVSELTATLPNIDALIGMDVLRQCLLVLDGPGQQFILGF